MITWNLSATAVQYGAGPVRLFVEGLQPGEHFSCKVTTPVDPPFLWKLQASPAGVLAEDLYLASGLGKYTFSVAEGCHEMPELSVLATACAPGGTESPSLELHVSRTNVSLGGRVTVDVVNAVPGMPVTIYRAFGTVLKSFEVTPNSAGMAALDTSLEEAGVHTFLASQSTRTAAGKQVFVVGNINELPTAGVDSCEGKITVIPRFLNPQAGNGSTAMLVVTVENSSDELLRASFNVTLPPAFTSIAAVQISNEPVSPRSARDFQFFLVANNPGDGALQAVLQILPSMGSYVCGGSARAIKGGQASLLISASAKPCGLEVTYAAFNLSTVSNGQVVSLAIRVRNTGAAAITNLSLLPVVPPTVLTGGSLQFAGVPLAPGEEYTYTKSFLVVCTTSSTAVVSVPAGSLTAVCQGSTIANLHATTTSVNVVP